MRFLSQEANQCLGNTIPPKSNFGLFFNKWLDYEKKGDKFVPTVKDDRSPLVNQAQQCKGAASKILQHHHVRQAEYCREMEKAGWKVFVFTARLDSPFVSGLGAAHPTETGMVLDHTSGMPYIPAASQKGVLRIAHIINSLCDDNGTEKPLKQLLAEGVVSQKNDEVYWDEDDASRTLFGYSTRTESLAGHMVVLDAYPLKAPELGEEILNPHFPDYYKQSRGPTEDQSPIPGKFLVVKPGAKFVFRILLRLPYGKAPVQHIGQLSDMAEKNIRKAISEVGMGAKTALGFGRFTVIQQGEPDEIESWLQTYQEQRRIIKEKIRQASEDKKYPWRKIFRKIGEVKDWGALKDRILASEELRRYQSEKEVGKAVIAIAEDVAGRHPKKWSSERDQAVAEWLRVSGATWQPLAKSNGPGTQSPEAKTESQHLTTIKGFSSEKKEGLKQFKQSKIQINKLDRQCAEALKEKFAQWKLKKSKDKNEKKLFKKLTNRLKTLQ